MPSRAPYMAEQDSKTLILGLFETHDELFCYQMVPALKLPYNTVSRCFQEMTVGGILVWSQN